eukprot:GHVU01226074.1.p2 GENE.GHVU01226074.1~~GHVU01226074.1.p2  ORF type:complete len:148 (+),score=6.36 GHVU01226074.1:50-445(+)
MPNTLSPFRGRQTGAMKPAKVTHQILSTTTPATPTATATAFLIRSIPTKMITQYIPHIHFVHPSIHHGAIGPAPHTYPSTQLHLVFVRASLSPIRSFLFPVRQRERERLMLAKMSHSFIIHPFLHSLIHSS